MAAAVVDLADLAGRALVLVEQGPGRAVEGLAEHPGAGVVGDVGEVLEVLDGEGEELAEAVPAQVVLLDEPAARAWGPSRRRRSRRGRHR